MKTKGISKITAALLAGVLLAGCASANNADQTLYDKVIENDKIVFATEGTYSPFSYHDENDNLVGFDVEVARAVADKLGVEAEFVETKWDGIIAGLDAKKYDTIANQVGITDERAEKYYFSEPYTYSYGSIITRDDNSDIQSFEDLDGKKSAQTANSNWADVVREYNGEIVGTEGFNQSIELVIQGRADATVNDSVTFLDYKNQKPDSPVKIAAESDDVTQSAFVFRKDDSAELRDAINQALQELAEDGTLAEISNKYFGEDVTAAK